MSSNAPSKSVRSKTTVILALSFVSFAFGQPVITEIAPLAASVGMPVVIVGSGFSPVPSENQVTIGGLSAAVLNPTAPGVIVAIVPSGAASGGVEVTVDGQNGIAPVPLTIESDPGFTNLLLVQADAGFQPLDFSVVNNSSPTMSITLDSSITSLVSGSYRVYAVVRNTLGPVDVTASFPLGGAPLSATTSGLMPAGVNTLVVMGTTTSGASFSFAGTMLNFDSSIASIGAEADADQVSSSPDSESGLDYQTELLEVQFYPGASLSVIRDVLAAYDVTPVGLTLDQTFAPLIPLDLYVDARRSSLSVVTLRDAIRSAPEVQNAWLNFLDAPLAVRAVGEQMPARLINGGPRPAYNSGTNNVAYNANNGGFDNDGDTVGGIGIDETDIYYNHFFYQTFAAQRLQSYVYANINPSGGGAGPARPLLAVVDTGFGNGTASVAAGNRVLNDIPTARLGATDADGVAFHGIQAETGAVNILAPVMVLGRPAAAAGDSRVLVQNLIDNAGANSHGTFVALLAAGGGAMLLGQTPGSTVIPYRVANGAGVIAQNNTNAALNNAAGRANVAVINLSLGSTNPAANAAAAVANVTAARSAALNAAWAANQITVFAAANCGVNANLFSPQTLADAQLVNPLVRPLMINVAAVDIPAPTAIGPVGPEQSWWTPNPPCAPGAGCAFVGTNFGNQIAVCAFGGLQFAAMGWAGALHGNSCGGTSWAAPQVAGLLVELIHLDQWTRGAPAGGAATATRRRQIIEYVLGSADDLGSTTAAAPFVNNDAGNGPIRSTDAPDPNFGYGRINSWKATLSVLNGGLAQQHGRTNIGGGGANTNNDTVHRNLGLVADGNSIWYGFEIVTSVQGATAWIDGTLVDDAGASVPANNAPQSASRIYGYKGVRSDLNVNRGIHQASDGTQSDPAVVGPPTRQGTVTDGDPTTGIVAVGTSVNNRGQYVITFSIRREDLYTNDGPKTLSLRLPGQTVASKPFYNLLLETAKMREAAPAGAHV
ncbi:MAG: IPT/TIG domain-containing protein, partial [Phycisphaerales bacterium]|nr:IPT/TIG domain-containing protein [Phycisphaerales bacterium]